MCGLRCREIVISLFPTPRSVKARFLHTQASFDPSCPPLPPAPGGRAGRWSSLAGEELARRDDLRLVAGLGERQAVCLRRAGVDTMRGLAKWGRGGGAGGAGVLRSVEGISQGVLARLARQAQLQVAAEAMERPPYDLLPEGRAVLGAMPPPCAADAFFDLEVRWNT